jgi:hypothetical protein
VRVVLPCPRAVWRKRHPCRDPRLSEHKPASKFAEDFHGPTCLAGPPFRKYDDTRSVAVRARVRRLGHLVSHLHNLSLKYCSELLLRGLRAKAGRIHHGIYEMQYLAMGLPMKTAGTAPELSHSGTGVSPVFSLDRRDAGPTGRGCDTEVFMIRCGAFGRGSCYRSYP